jgi:hypothetical protein
MSRAADLHIHTARGDGTVCRSCELFKEREPDGVAVTKAIAAGWRRAESPGGYRSKWCRALR